MSISSHLRGSPRLTHFAGVAVAAGLSIFTAPQMLSAAVTSTLADAVEHGDASVIRSIVRDTDVNAPQVDGMTALHWAVYHDDVDTTKTLLAAKANAGAANRYGVTPLSIACTNGNAVIVGLLLDAGADANAALPGGETPLMTASRTGNLAPVKALLAHGA